MEFFQQLVRATEGERQDLQSIPFIQAGIAGEVTRAQYLAFLTEAYHHVNHTIPLLMACGARIPESLSWLRSAVGEYIEEEMGHEEWILNDIRACGGDAEAVRHGQPLPATELMVAYAYDIINRVNPVGFFGMVYVLEGTSVALATRAAEVIQQKLGLPQEAFSYLTSHGSLDISHIGFFEGLMNRIEDAALQQQIIHCAKVFFQLYGNIFRTLGSINNQEETSYAVA